MRRDRSHAREQVDPLVGAAVGRLVIVERLGRAGSCVYRARDERSGAERAVKVLPASFAAEDDERESFLEQCLTMRRMRHRGLVHVREAGVVEDRVYVVCDLVDGPDLAEELALRGALEPARTVQLLAPVASALDGLHDRGIVHGDVRPANVLLIEDGAGAVTDAACGRLSAALLADDPVGPTRAAAFASPEQVRGGPVDGRTDVYALAGVIHACLTGAPPYTTVRAADVVGAHLHEPPPRPSDTAPSLGTAFDDLVARGMAKDPADRPATCRALVQALRRAVAAAEPPVVANVAIAPAAAPSRPAPTRPARRDPEPDASPPVEPRGIVAARAVVAVALVGAAFAAVAILGRTDATSSSTGGVVTVADSGTPLVGPNFAASGEDAAPPVTTEATTGAAAEPTTEATTEAPAPPAASTAVDGADSRPDARPVPVLPFPSLVASRGRALVGLDEGGAVERELTLPEVGAAEPAAVQDASLLAIVRLGDLWTLSADGTLVRLTQTPEAEGGPAWSPGGGRLAFERVDSASATLDVWTMNADATDARNLTPGPLEGESPAWAPDGDHLAFVRELAIWTMATDGAEARRVSGGVPGAEHDPAWSPDGRAIAFACGPSPDVEGICTVEPSGENPRNLTPLGVPGASEPVWSPDGDRVAFVARDGLWEVGADGQGLRRLVADDRLTALTWVRAPRADAG